MIMDFKKNIARDHAGSSVKLIFRFSSSRFSRTKIFKRFETQHSFYTLQLEYMKDQCLNLL